jgi:UrcA family protein
VKRPFFVVTKEITMLFRSFTATAAAILALVLTAAHADELNAADLSKVSTMVPFGDLNLSQPSDAKVLAGRLENAAKSVCLKANPDIVSPFLTQQCVRSAIRTAMGAIEDRLDQDVSDKLVVVRISLESP